MHFGRDSRCVFIVLKSSPSTGARPGWISGLGSENVGTMWELARSPTPENSEHARIVETPPFIRTLFAKKKKFYSTSDWLISKPVKPLWYRT